MAVCRPFVGILHRYHSLQLVQFRRTHRVELDVYKRQLKERICHDAHTLLCYVTRSGNGLRVIYRYEGDDYPAAFAMGNDYYAHLIGKESDPDVYKRQGLHFHDIKRLLHAFNALIERGHSLVVIEHNLDVIKCADYIIGLGPEGGDKGGNLVVAGTPEEVAACKASLTGKFLR